jgi:chaperonin GroES
MEGTILAVGEGRRDDSGAIIPMLVKAGDKVLFAKYSGTEFKIDEVEYLILAEKDILGIIQE